MSWGPQSKTFPNLSALSALKHSHIYTYIFIGTQQNKSFPSHVFMGIYNKQPSKGKDVYLWVMITLLKESHSWVFIIWSISVSEQQMKSKHFEEMCAWKYILIQSINSFDPSNKRVYHKKRWVGGAAGVQGKRDSMKYQEILEQNVLPSVRRLELWRHWTFWKDNDPSSLLDHTSVEEVLDHSRGRHTHLTESHRKRWLQHINLEIFQNQRPLSVTNGLRFFRNAARSYYVDASWLLQVIAAKGSLEPFRPHSKETFNVIFKREH